jgi:hypothetical protein
LSLFALSPGAVRADALGDLSAARDLWKAVSIANYTFEYTNRDDTLMARPCNWDVLRTHVRNGKPWLSVVVSGIGRCAPGTVLPASKRKNVPRTIEDLFAVVERLLKLGAE